MLACAAFVSSIVLAGPAIIGVGTVGPVAGGLFAGAQAAGWVGAGTFFAGVQSAVMAGTVKTIVGSAAACFTAEKMFHKDSDSGDSK